MSCFDYFQNLQAQLSLLIKSTAIKLIKPHTTSSFGALKVAKDNRILNNYALSSRVFQDIPSSKFIKHAGGVV